MAVPIQPMDEYVVVEQEKVRAKTASGILLPESAQEKPKTAKVVAVGSDVKSVKIGDRVIYKNDYEATAVTIGSDEYSIIYKKNIIATVK